MLKFKIVQLSPTTQKKRICQTKKAPINANKKNKQSNPTKTQSKTPQDPTTIKPEKKTNRPRGYHTSTMNPKKEMDQK